MAAAHATMRGRRRRGHRIDGKSECRGAAPCQNRRAEPGAERNASRHAGDAKGVPECQPAQHGHHHSRDRRDQRCLGVFAGEERGRQNLHQNVCGQAEREDRQCLCGRGGIRGGERAMLKQDADDRLAEQSQPKRCRQHEAHCELKRAGFRVHQCLAIASLNRAGQFGNEHRSHGHADHAEGQFNQAIGKIEPRDRCRR